MSVQVGVRVRPFNAREKKLSSKCIISMPGENQTHITNEKEKEKIFTFDYSFWSHDDYKILDDGYLSPISDKYADQKKVFNSVGKQVLDNAWQGYHCCLFAYGQTGSGKSYSMVGYGANKGIVPISCEEIFKSIEQNKKEDKIFEVQVSMLEIYNEKVQDLLIPPKQRPNGGLRIRESKVLGIFVEGLTKYPVTSYEQIAQKMDEGYQNRTIGSTLMNATSSRAHTIVTIEFKQITILDKKRSEKLSRINLVDLAGSERTGITGSTGERLKEGCNINKSLLILGNVINCLADKALGIRKNMLPPYRDSALTRILQNALGGNSKTIMICAISPASINYEESLSTLRYADRAKKIQNKAIVNESEHDKMVRLLKEENDNLKKLLEDLQKNILGQKNNINENKAYKELKEQYEANELMMVDMEKTFNEKLEEAKKEQKERIGEEIDITKPHLVVLDEDEQLSHKLKYSLNILPIYVGKKNGNPPPHITLTGIWVSANHAVFEKQEDDIILKPRDIDAKKYIYVNGKNIDINGIVLQNKDRIAFGTNAIFLFMKKSDGKDIYSVEWETCQAEIHNEIEEEKKRQEEENQRIQEEKMILLKKNMEEEFNREKKEMEDELKKQEENYLNQIKELNENAEKQKMEQERIFQEKKLREKLEQLQNEKIKKRRELEIREKKEMSKLSNSRIIINNKQNKEKLEKNLIILLRKLAKLKLMISELKREIDIEVILQKDFMEKKELYIAPEIKIRVQNYEEGSVYYWNAETFHNRFDLTRELFNKYMDEDYDINTLSKEDDPLWDEQDESLMGYAFFKMESLSYLIATKNELNIINPYYGKLMGIIEIEIIPHDDKNNEFDEVPESPYDLIGQNLLYKVRIIKVKNLNINFCKNLRIEYQSFYDKSINYTKIYNQNEDKNTEFDIGEEFEHKIEYLTKEDVDFLNKENIKFKIYASEDVPKKEIIINEENEENIEIDDNENDKNKLDIKNEMNTVNNYINDELDEPSECIKKDGVIKNNEPEVNKKKIKGRGRSESQKFKKKTKNKDKDCNIF